MLKNSLNYPYPVLRCENVDYKNSKLICEINLSSNVDSFIITASITTNNKEINNLIRDGKVKKGLFVEAKSVWFRKFYDFTNVDTICISSKELFGSVFLTPCIVAIDYIDNFYSDDFCQEYSFVKDSNIHINKGEVLAIGDTSSFDAYFEKDIFKSVSNIFQFISSDSDKVAYDLSNDAIVISLPKEMYNIYCSLSRGSYFTNHILNSMLITPVLISTLHDINNDYDSYIEKKWFLTIKKALEDKKINIENEAEPIENPLLCSQLLTEGLLLDSISTLEKFVDGR